MNRPSVAGPHNQAVYTRRRFAVATVAVLVPSLSYALVRRGSTPAGSLSKPLEMSTTSTNRLAQAAPMVAPTAVLASTGPVIDTLPIQFDQAVGVGMNGSNVVAIQDRLRQLGFDPGPSDASFGPATERAVWAFEKFILGMERSAVAGVVTSEMWLRMNEPIEVRPRRADPGTHLEVLLAQQVAVLYVDNQVRLITHVSSGTGEEWCDVVLIDNDDGIQHEEGICGVAVTPGGVFHFDRRVAGWKNSKLGRLYNPVYFNYGIAVHGATNVPAAPASHGCVRIPMHIAEYFPSLVQNGDLVYVFDGVKEPEFYGAQVPTFDYPDRSYMTTTSSPTTIKTTMPTTTDDS